MESVTGVAKILADAPPWAVLAFMGAALLLAVGSLVLTIRHLLICRPHQRSTGISQSELEHGLRTLAQAVTNGFRFSAAGKFDDAEETMADWGRVRERRARDRAKENRRG